MAKQVQDNSKFTGIRLPTTVKPIHYDIELKPNLKEFTFQGEVQIQYEATEATKSVVVHANEIVITEGSVTDDSTTSPLDTVYYSKDSETATLEFRDTIRSSGKLSLKFTGILNDKMKGFYRTSFKIGDTVVHAATTQFEATDARECFPCWDEPNIKATFSASLIIEKYIEANGQKYECLALSNMNEISRSGTDEELKVVFAKTPIMSTYLLAFVVGPFEALEGTDSRRPVRVFTTPGKAEQGRFALDVACKSLPFFEDYFSVKYDLPKMDLIAVPDFCGGAMENWGLVTYRETCLLFDPNNTATHRKQYIAIVVAHELSHQWFGNLVTMEWWTDLWLKEGFASFMEYLCVDNIFPEYDVWSQFVTDSYGCAMELDCLHNSHPVEVPVKHPSEIDEIFDDISYNKGASVIRMLYDYIGDDSFRKGMKLYLDKFAYKNAVTEDLWDSLELASSKPVRKLMSGWTRQKGHPWLSIGYKLDGNDAKLTVTQNKFTADGDVPPEEEGMTWMIPISAISGNEPTKVREVHLLNERTSEIEFKGAGDSWLKLNPGAVGLYRSAYPDELLKKLRPAILDQTLAPLDRLGIQSDYFALNMAGKVSSIQLLELLSAYKGEINYSVWNSIDTCLHRLNIMVRGTDCRPLLHKFGRELYTEIFKKIGWSAKPGEKHVDALTRTLVINRLISFGDENLIGEAKRRFAAHVDKTQAIPADLRGAVYKAVSVYGDDKAFESLFDIYRSAELSEEKNRVARAIGSSTDPGRLERAVKFALSDELRYQDKIFVIIPIGYSNPDVSWKFVQDHKDMILEKYGSGTLLPRLIKYTIENFTAEEKALEVIRFFEANKFPGAERAIQQAVETIRINARWVSRELNKMKSFLEQQ